MCWHVACQRLAVRKPQTVISILIKITVLSTLPAKSRVTRKSPDVLDYITIKAKNIGVASGLTTHVALLTCTLIYANAMQNAT